MTTTPGPTSDDFLNELATLARTAAARAAALLVDGLSSARATVDTKSSTTDMVTEMDHASEALIVETIRAARPDDGIVAEEGSALDGTSGVEWVIDPLDGTTNYLYGHPGFAVSIAVQVSGETIVGVVHDPLHRNVFTAARGRGARRNDEAITASTKADLSTALVATGFSYEPERRRCQAEVLRSVLPQVRDIRRMGAAAVDLCSVATGQVDAFYERGLAPWDHAAGALIAEEAGATVGDLDGGPPSGAFVLAAPPALFPPLSALLADAGAGAA